MAIVEKDCHDNGTYYLNKDNYVCVLYFMSQLHLRLLALVLNKEPRCHICAYRVFQTGELVQVAHFALFLTNAILSEELLHEVITKIVTAVAVCVTSALKMVLKPCHQPPINDFTDLATRTM